MLNFLNRFFEENYLMQKVFGKSSIHCFPYVVDRKFHIMEKWRSEVLIKFQSETSFSFSGFSGSMFSCSAPFPLSSPFPANFTDTTKTRRCCRLKWLRKTGSSVRDSPCAQVIVATRERRNWLKSKTKFIKFSILLLERNFFFTDCGESTRRPLNLNIISTSSKLSQIQHTKICKILRAMQTSRT